MTTEVLSITISEQVTADNGEVYVRVDGEYGTQWYPTMGGGAFMLPDEILDNDDLEEEYQQSRQGYYEKLEDEFKAAKGTTI